MWVSPDFKLPDVCWHDLKLAHVLAGKEKNKFTVPTTFLMPNPTPHQPIECSAANGLHAAYYREEVGR